MSRYPIPSKHRARRGALFSLVLVIALLATAVATDAWFWREAPTYQIREDWIMTPAEPTPPPSPLPAATSEPVVWVRYDCSLSDDLQRYTEDVCKQYDVPTALVLAVMKYESEYNSDAISEDRCDYGLMQVRAAEHTDRCIRLNTYNLLDARQNILTGVDYLAELIGWGYGTEYALSWYHGDGGGPSKYAQLILAEAERLEESTMSTCIKNPPSEAARECKSKQFIGGFKNV